jgi:hypothetical protein
MQIMYHQKGMATILLVLLIGLTAMIITSTVARGLVTNKEAKVTSHAQTNAQIMGWAGVNAFREHLFELGKRGVHHLKKLENTSVTLRNDLNQKVIVAKNIKVVNCEREGHCLITADISSNNLTSQAATTIHAIYQVDIKTGEISIPSEMPSLNFSGDTFLSGTTLSAEIPNTKAVLNVDGGHVSIQAGFKTHNISKLTINAKKDNAGRGGDVIIDCSLTACGNIEIDINAEGHVHIIHPGKFGTIKALEWVKLQTGVTAGNIEALGTVDLALKSTAENIRTLGNVELSEGSSAQNIFTNGDVKLRTNVTASSVQTIGSVRVSVDSRVLGDVISGQHIDISNSTVGGNVKAYEYVDLDTSSKVNGSVFAQNKSKQGIGTNKSAVRMSTSWVGGSVYANGHLRMLDSLFGEDVHGDVYLTGEIKALSWSHRTIIGTVKEKMTWAALKTTVPAIEFTIPPALDPTIFTKQVQDEIAAHMDFVTKVDVLMYKDQSNYIFTKENGAARIYLNHLRNEDSQLTYIYENGQQYVYDHNNQKTLVNSQGFYLGKYTLNGKHYVGAICQEVEQEQAMTNSSLVENGHRSGYCKSEIIGYLPRVSLDFNGFNGAERKIFGWPDDYDFTLPDSFYIRSTQESSIDNAAFAPGIMYFEGKLIISGDENIHADSMTTAFTNSFLAEGSIDAIAMSPRIFSPYNVLREGQENLICSRQLQSVNGEDYQARPPQSLPNTLSSRFLTPVNLCKDANTFSYTMNKKPNSEIEGEEVIEKIKIDGVEVNKLDLGLVALMSNRVIRIGACARIYGDVLAKSNVEGSASCGVTSNPNGIYGSISSEGQSPTALNVQQHNTFGAGSNLIIPDKQYTNVKPTGELTMQTGLRVEDARLKWAKYL